MSSGFPRFRGGAHWIHGVGCPGVGPRPRHPLVPPYVNAVTRVTLAGPVTAPWHLGAGPVPPVGTRVQLMLQGHTRGLVGRGVVRSAPFRAGPTDRPGTLGTHVLIEWDQLRHGPECDRVPSDTWKPIHGRKTSDGQSYSQQKAPESSVSPAHSGPSSPSRSQIWTSTRGAAEPSACMTRPSIRIPAMHPLYSGSKRSRHGG